MTDLEAYKVLLERFGFKRKVVDGPDDFTSGVREYIETAEENGENFIYLPQGSGLGGFFSYMVFGPDGKLTDFGAAE